MKVEERFINYTKFDTQSDELSDTVPSTAKQLCFAEYLRDEMISEGLEDVVLDDKGYLYGTLPASPIVKEKGEPNVPTIGFIAHYDTSPDCSGTNIKAYIRHDDTSGDDIIYANDPSTGTQGALTLLGADDKAGIAEIMQAVCYLRDNPDIKHGKIRVGFNPDEEIGRGAHHFDVERFGCDFAYTIDGGAEGELEYENFNAASAKVLFTGLSIHPGYAKGKMINAARVAMEFASMIPTDQLPETTEGYEGFYHLTSITGNCENAQLSYIIRDHDRERFEERKGFMKSLAKTINEKFGVGVCNIIVADQYYNMLEQIRPHMHIIARAKEAMVEAGVTPKVQPIRGGTDGAQLSFMGLPCPNIFTGAIDFHGPNEHISIRTMEKAVKTIVNIAKISD